MDHFYSYSSPDAYSQYNVYDESYLRPAGVYGGSEGFKPINDRIAPDWIYTGVSPYCYQFWQRPYRFQPCQKVWNVSGICSSDNNVLHPCTLFIKEKSDLTA